MQRGHECCTGGVANGFDDSLHYGTMPPGGHMAEKLCPSLRVSLRSKVLRGVKEVGGQSGIASGHKGISSSGH